MFIWPPIFYSNNRHPLGFYQQKNEGNELEWRALQLLYG